MRPSKNKQVVVDVSNLSKLPPQAADLEESVVGALMLESSAVKQVIDVLFPEDFYVQSNRTIYEAILQLYSADRAIDMRTVVAQLRTNGQIAFVGGAHYIAELTSKVSSAANIEFHARILIEYSIKRRLITVSAETMHLAYEDTTDVFDLLDKSQLTIDSIGGKYLKGNFKSSLELTRERIKQLMDRKDHRGITGIPTGLSKLDRITGGWQPTDLIVVAARPGMGKTAFIISAAINSAMAGIPTAIFSLEMGSMQLIDRALSAAAEIENTKITKNYLSEQDWTRLGQVSQQIGSIPLYVDDTPAINIMEFRARARRLVHEKKVQAIYLDYIQLMHGDSDSNNRDQEIGSITRGLKRVAKELGIPIIALSQLSRAVETRGGDKRPQLSDLRESGSIEQDADLVAFLYRAEYYKIETDSDGRPTQGVMEVIIQKHRNGGLDNIPLKFIGKFTKVTDWDEAPKPIQEPVAPVASMPSSNSSEYRAPYKDSNDDLPF